MASCNWSIMWGEKKKCTASPRPAPITPTGAVPGMPDCCKHHGYYSNVLITRLCIKNQARTCRYKFQTVTREQQETACNCNLTPWHQTWVCARQAASEHFIEEPLYRVRLWLRGENRTHLAYQRGHLLISASKQMIWSKLGRSEVSEIEYLVSPLAVLSLCCDSVSVWHIYCSALIHVSFALCSSDSKTFIF